VVKVTGKGSGRISIAALTCYKPERKSRLIYRMMIHRGRKGEKKGFREHDFAARLEPSARLIGRENELNTLRSAFAYSLVGACNGVLVTGGPGVGKTTLINALRPLAAAHRGWFVTGKSDQYRQDASASGLNQAFRALGRLLLAESEAELAPLRAQLRLALGPNAGLLASTLPEFALLLGVEPEVIVGDPAAAGLATGAAVGLLGIELETRRRNRMNGTVTRADKSGFAVRVEQSFGNCPKYIQARKPVFVAEPSLDAAPPVRAEGAILSASAAELVRGADTFFIATASEGVDVSHRGGKPGFVRVAEQDGHTVLTSPDFSGNFYFNTLGNLLLNPRAGLVFVDFASGGLLSLTGEADTLWDGPELAAFAGAERLLRFRVTEGVWIEPAAPLRWSAPEPAPQLAATGSWEGTASPP